MPDRFKTLEVKDKTYKIEYPNTGQFIDIERQKMTLSGGEYRGLMDSGTVGAFNALNFVDMTVYFNVLVPQLVKDLNVTSIFQLNPIDAADLFQVYKGQLMPWLRAWTEAINEKMNPQKKEDQETVAEVNETAK